MKGTVELLDEVKRRHGLTSDYQLHQRLGVTRAQISKYRTGRDYLSEETAVKVADMLQLERGVVLAWIAGERAKMPSARDAWRVLAERLGGTAAAVLVAYLLAPALPDLTTAAATVSALCIMSSLTLGTFLFIISLLPFHPHKKL